MFERLQSDPELVALLGGPDRITPGWIGEETEPTDYPRITFYLFGPSPIARGVQRVRGSTDLWVWPTGENGGRTRLLEIDSRVSDLFAEQGFTHAGHWIMGSNLGFRDFPGGPDEPLRRLRELALDVTTT